AKVIAPPSVTEPLPVRSAIVNTGADLAISASTNAPVAETNGPTALAPRSPETNVGVASLTSALPRRFRYHFGEHPRCPKCGTLRITKLKHRDQIDPMSGSFLNLLERMCGG